MKNSNTCPKCNGQNICRIDGHVKLLTNLGAGNLVQLSPLEGAYVTRYICKDCGFSEDWVEGKDLDKLNKHFHE